ncbi:MAG: branched-chain amino acid ABC transporter permease [Candidatus Bipolaricaulota bacterium]|nr:branched-chain amino acid ABC transporter permease [Candidatus Bipolaricaulota bacterium]
MKKTTLRKLFLFVGLLLVGLLIPLIIKNPYWLHVFVMAYFYGLLAATWSFLDGYAGQFSFGNIALVVIAGYTSGLLGTYTGLPLPLGMIAGVLAAGVVGLFIGYLCLRFKGAYLSLFTIAFAEAIRIILNTEHQITRGPCGLHVEGLFRTSSQVPYYYLMFLLLAISLFVMYRMLKSRWGLFFQAIREDDEAASAMGVNVVRYKIIAFVVTSIFCGIGGVFYAHFTEMLTPNFGQIATMGLVIGMAIIGGVENLIAAMLGGIIVEFGLEGLREFGAWRMVLFGGLLMLVVRFARNGLLAPLYKKFIGEEV